MPAIDTQALEEAIASETLEGAAELLDVTVAYIEENRKSDAGFRRAYQRGMVRREAANLDSNGSKPDDVILRAIGLGFGTRKALREALGFGYDVIEKCIERNLQFLDTRQNGQIEDFILKNKLDDAAQIIPDGPVQHVCKRCGGPRSAGSIEFCRKCYGKNVNTMTHTTLPNEAKPWSLTRAIKDILPAIKTDDGWFTMRHILAELESAFPIECARYQDKRQLRSSITATMCGIHGMFTSKKIRSELTDQMINAYRMKPDEVFTKKVEATIAPAEKITIRRPEPEVMAETEAIERVINLLPEIAIDIPPDSSLNKMLTYTTVIKDLIRERDALDMAITILQKQARQIA